MARATLVALASVILVVAAVRSATSEKESRAALPSWVPRTLEGLTLRAAGAGDVFVDRAFAIGAVRGALFLGEGPETAPDAVPVLVTGRVARGPLPVSPTGDVEIPRAVDAPGWLVAWRGLDGSALLRFGTWEEGTPVDAVFVVDGITGDCCWVNLFLAGGGRLGGKAG